LKTGAQLLVDTLLTNGASIAYGVPGESYLAVLDALYDARDRFRFVVCRQEGGAAYMAEAHGKLTGAPGICFVTRGPGASNASIGVHTAYQDSTPMILFVGQVGNDFVEREAFQEIDYRRMYGQMAKWVAQIDRADRVPEYVSRAFHVATSGRPGPVVLALPEDMLSEAVPEAAGRPLAHYRVTPPSPSPAQVEAVRERLQSARRPLVLCGGAGWNEAAVQALQRFIPRSGLPVACAFRCQDLYDNDDPHYVGEAGIGINPELARRIKEADLLLALGPRLDEMTTSGYTLVQSPRPAQALVHVHVHADELNRVYQADLAVNAGMEQMLEPLAGLDFDPAPWREWREQGRRSYESWNAANRNPGPVQMAELIKILQDKLPEDAILANGAGNYSAWLHRFYRYRRPRTQLAPRNGSMGYGVPAAVAAKIENPARTVVALAGDGCFLMTGQELATAAQYGANVIVIVIDNGMYGTIRLHQERHYPGRVSGTGLSNPDFSLYARAFGAHAERVEDTAAFGPALERCLQARGPALIEVRIDPQALSTQATIDQVREQGLARARAGGA